MKPLSALIVDDEAPARAKLRRYLAATSQVTVVGEADGGRAAVELALALRPELMFLDVQMPDLDGFGVIEALAERAPPTVVFVTAHDAFALRAFEVHAFDYLLKPVSPERFERLLARLSTRVQAPASAEALEQRIRALLAELPQATGYAAQLLVVEDERAHFLEVDTIDRVEADRNYLLLHCGERRHRMRGTLERIQGKLDPTRFLRINRSELVRIGAIREALPWPNGEYRLLLANGKRVTWTRAYVERAPRTLLQSLS
jgi:two-component system LytT family response regulator